jgi:hypothetical protein
MGRETARLNQARVSKNSKASTGEPKSILGMGKQSFSHLEASPNNTKPSTVLVNQGPAQKSRFPASLRILRGISS